MSLIGSYTHRTLTRTRPGPPDEWGASGAGTEASCQARYVARQERYRTPDGSLALSRAVAYVPGAFDIRADDLVAIEGVSTGFRAKQVEDVPTLGGGVDHRKVYLE